MLKRIYIDNYRCFSNFEFKPARVNLILGHNGSGKTSLIDALSKIVRIVAHGGEVSQTFPTDTLTRWDTRDRQRFELDVDDGEARFHYELELKHDRSRGRVSIVREAVSRAGLLLFLYDEGTVHLHKNDGTEGTSFPFGGARSFLAEIEERSETQTLRWLLSFLSRMQMLKLAPSKIKVVSDRETESLAPDGSNFASWYRNLQQERPESLPTFFAHLRDTIPGFQSLKLRGLSVQGRTRALSVAFKQGDQAYEMSFDELSDGQRVLIVLYALLLDLDENQRLLVLDEPGNFLALSEIQPWLAELSDVLGDGQLMVVSHSPEVIDYLAANSPFWLDRQAGGPVRIREQLFERESGLRASEQISRGLLGP